MRLSLVTGLRSSDTFVGRSEVFHFTRRLTISKQRVNYEPQQCPRGDVPRTSAGNVLPPIKGKRRVVKTERYGHEGESGSGRNWMLKRGMFARRVQKKKKKVKRLHCFAGCLVFQKEKKKFATLSSLLFWQICNFALHINLNETL